MVYRPRASSQEATLVRISVRGELRIAEDVDYSLLAKHRLRNADTLEEGQRSVCQLRQQQEFDQEETQVRP